MFRKHNYVRYDARMARRRFTDEQLDEAAKDAKNIDEIVARLGGTSRRTVLIHLNRLKHPALSLCRSDVGLKRGVKKLPLEKLLTKGTERNTVNIKNRLFDEGLKHRECEECGITEWCGKPAPLQLDHHDGDRRNNLLENLRILCANCHALTPTFCGKNVSRLRRSEMITDRS